MSQGVGSSGFLDKWELYSVEFNDVATEDCGHCKYKYGVVEKIRSCYNNYGLFLINKGNTQDVVLCKYACYRNEIKISDGCIKECNEKLTFMKNNNRELKQDEINKLFEKFQQNYIHQHTRKINEYVQQYNCQEYLMQNASLKFFENLKLITDQERKIYNNYTSEYNKSDDIDYKNDIISSIKMLHKKIKKEFDDRNNKCRELIRQRVNEAINNNNLGFTQVTENFWLRNNLVSRENHPLPRSFYINTCDPEINQKVFISSASNPDCHQIPQIDLTYLDTID